ncbi:hypothetical protein Clacol_009658 [Clathrus columnatus]|uniref:SWI/SNF and RSC complexes subunit Ssr4 N-terminal domain-containing protein n=1 Tax=Clathrus columnatus TaxID=1419009 RepID=A0AAV5ANK9_9AGAM|nr:hypothetical protein Clacol_009658 [Clathrus columnatus]
MERYAICHSRLRTSIFDHMAFAGQPQQQQQPSAPPELFLRYPENVGIQPQISFDQAVNLLIQAVDFSQRVPFAWTFVDKPPAYARIDGQAYLIYSTQPSAPLPCDGIRWLETERTYRLPANGRELEVGEIKFGFVPGVESFASRMRRKYRLTKGGNPGLILVHYLRAEQTAIPNHLINVPVRQYPLRQVSEPRIFVAGERIGQRVPIVPVGGVPIAPQANGMTAVGPVGPMPGGGPSQMSAPVPPPPQPHMNPMGINMGLGLGIAPAALAQQTQAHDALERERRARMAAAAGGMNVPPGAGAGVPPPTAGRPVEEDDSADEHEPVSTRTLAIGRFRRNHDLMSEVFFRASQGKRTPKTYPSPYASLNLSDMTAKIETLTSEVAALESHLQQKRSRLDKLMEDSQEVSTAMVS